MLHLLPVPGWLRRVLHRRLNATGGRGLSAGVAGVALLPSCVDSEQAVDPQVIPTSIASHSERGVCGRSWKNVREQRSNKLKWTGHHQSPVVESHHRGNLQIP